MYSPRRLERAKGRGFEDSRLVLEPHSSEFRDLHLRALCPTLRYRGEELEEGDAIVVDDEMVDEAGLKLAAAILARGEAAGMGGTT